MCFVKGDALQQALAVGRDVVHAVLILLLQQLHGIHQAQHILVGGVNNGAVHTGVHRQSHEGHVQRLAEAGEAEGDVAQAAGDVDVGIAALDLLAALGEQREGLLIGGRSLYQRINVQAAGGNAVLLRLGHDLVKDLHPVLHALGNAALAQKRDAAPVGVGNGGEYDVRLHHAVGVLLHGHGVDDAGTAAELEGLGADGGAGAVHRDGHMLQLLGDGSLHLLDHPLQGLHLHSGIGGRTHVDVQGNRLLKIILILGGHGLGAGTLADELRVTLRNCLCHRGDGAIEFLTDDDQ